MVTHSSKLYFIRKGLAMVHIFRYTNQSFVYEDDAGIFWTCEDGGWRIVEDEIFLGDLNHFFKVNRLDPSIVTVFKDTEDLLDSVKPSAT